MSYEQNIQRLSSTSRFNTSQAQQFETENANNTANWYHRKAEQEIKGLSIFSKTLQDHRKKQIEAAKQEGARVAREHRAVDAHRLLELEQLLPQLKEDDRRYHELKAEMLKLQGTNVYPDADRIAKLSPYQQYGYAQERLKNAMTSYEDTLNYRMQNGETPYTLNGITYTAKQLRTNNINSLPLKEALVQIESAKLQEEMGLNNFSPELLELSGVNKTIDTARNNYLGKVRKRYNIDSSMQTQSQSALAWKNSAKTGEDIHHFLVTTGATVDKNNNLLGNEGAWSSFMNVVGKEGIALGDPNYADTIGNIPIPPALAAKVGARPGTTFAQHWPTRFANLKTAIQKGHMAVTEHELKYQQNAGKELVVDFIKAAREKPLSETEVNEWKRKFSAIGLPIPADITKYETASDMDQRESEDAIKALMASQNGYISNEQLDAYHPLAALEYREKATKLEKAALKEFGSQDKIKAALNTAFTNMGIKGNEKSLAWVEAFENAKADYAVKYNRYVAMGYSAEEASYHALHSPQVSHPETNKPIVDSMGVLAEIKQNGEASKYVIIGQSVEKSLKPGHIRVAQIQMGKQEILNDRNVVTSKIIGGDYGHRQITTIKNNLDKYGPRGLYLDKGALAYYQGLARGRNAREGGFWGLVDAQLKASGHKGLNPATRPEMLNLTTGKDKDGNLISDRRGHSVVNKRIAAATQYSSMINNLYVLNMLQDEINYGQTPGSVWDQPQNLNPWLVGGTA